MEPGQDSPTTRSIVELLRADDAQIGALFDRFSAAERNESPVVVRDRLVGRICETLSIQRLAEEEVLYPALRAADEKLVFGFLLAGVGISMRIGEVRDPGKSRARRDYSVSRLIEMVRRNLQERARILLPFALGRLSETQLRWLGDDYLQRKARLWTIANAANAPRGLVRSVDTVPERKAVPLALRRWPTAPGEARPR